MVRYTITPWRNQRDLLAVRRQLYGDAEQRSAVDRVMAWKLRGNLPHAVESTALLVDAILHHSIEGNSIFSVRAVYSAAFSRFVTGFCDIGRHKERSLEPSSMLDIAKQIGMPTAFVGLRHEATHEELPAIQRLVKATKEALEWLWNVYWSRLEEPESDEVLTSSLPKVKAQAKEIYRSWRTARRESLRGRNQRQQDEEVQATASSCVALMREKGTSSVVSRGRAMAEVLVQERLLLPSKRERGSSLDGAFLIWDALIHEIVKQQKFFLNALIDNSLAGIDPTVFPAKDDVEIEGICMWLLHMLDFATEDPQRRAMRAEVMQWCCTHPGEWSNFVGSRVLESSDAECVEDWKDIFEASQLQQSQAETASDVEMADVASMIRLTDFSVDRPAWTRAATVPGVPIGVVR